MGLQFLDMATRGLLFMTTSRSETFVEIKIIEFAGPCLNLKGHLGGYLLDRNRIWLSALRWHSRGDVARGRCCVFDARDQADGYHSNLTRVFASAGYRNPEKGVGPGRGVGW
jgi:hypothetical protein